MLHGFHGQKIKIKNLKKEARRCTKEDGEKLKEGETKLYEMCLHFMIFNSIIL